MNKENQVDTSKEYVAPKEPESFDLDALLAPEAQAATFKVGVIFNEDGDPVSGFEIVGRNSEQHRKVDKELSIVSRKAAAARSTAIDQKTDAGAAKMLTVEEARGIARCAAVTVGWFGWTMTDASGKKVPRPFDAAMMTTILKQKPTWVEKIALALFEDSNFLPKSQATSAPTPNSN